MATSSSCCCSSASELWEQIKTVRLELFVIFVIIFPNAIPLTVDAQLQEDTYGKDDFYTYSGILSTVQGIVSIIAAPLLGSLSDFYGRTKPVVFCLVVTTIPAIIVVASENYWAYYISRSICAWYGPAFSIVVASVIDKFRKRAEDLQELENSSTSVGNSNNNNGAATINGSNISLGNEASSSSSSGTGRTKTTSNRIGSLSLCVLCFVGGFLVGSLVGTAVEDLHKKFIIALVFDILAIIIVSFVGVSNKPTSMQEKLEQQEQEHQANPSPIVQGKNDNTNDKNDDDQNDDDSMNHHENERTNLISTGATTTSNNDHHEVAHNSGEKIMKLLKNKNLMIAVVIVFMDFLAEQALQTLVLLYVKDQLHFSSQDQEGLLLVLGIGSVIALLVSIRVLTNLFSLISILRLALVFNATSVILFGFANKKWEIFAIPSLSVVGILVFPTMSSVASMTADDEDAGAAQGFVAAGRFFAEGISPTIFGIFLQHTKGTSFPGLPFVVAGLCPMIGALLSMFLPNDLGEKKQKINEDDEADETTA